jgi:dihydrofolate reductase
MNSVLKMREFDLVVATTKSLGIGKNGTMSWRLKDDLNYFRKVTTETKDPAKKNVCIMGRKTYFSIPEKFRPLPNRHNIIISNNQNLKT